MENHSSIQEVLFFTRAFSKFSPELQQSALQPASAGALHGMTSSRKWSEKSKSWTSQNPKGSYCGHFQNELSLVQFLGSGQKVCLDGGDGGVCSCAFLQHSECCTAKHQRQECSSPPSQANPHGWQGMTPGLVECRAWSFRQDHQCLPFTCWWWEALPLREGS